MRKAFSIILILSIILVFSTTSCKKGSESTDGITFHLFTPPLQISGCGSDKYLLDLDLDGKPDLVLYMNCITGKVISTGNYGQTSLQYAYNATDSILNNSFYFGSEYTFNSIISPSDYFGNFDGSKTVLSYCYEINQQGAPDSTYCGNSNSVLTSKYFAFVKEAATGYKYGWFAIHFDSNYNLYLDGVAINNVTNQPILAGRH